MPGPWSGAQAGAGLVRSALRLIGQDQIATAIEAATGVGKTGNVKKFVRRSIDQLNGQGRHEFQAVGEADQSAAEELVGQLLKDVAADTSAERRSAFQAAAVAGPELLVRHLKTGAVANERQALPGDARAYFDVLLRIVAASVCEWYASDRDAAHSAGLAAQGATLRELEEIAKGVDTTGETLAAVLVELRMIRSDLLDNSASERGMTLISAARPIEQIDPEGLGIHPAVAENGATGLTPYLARQHDGRLRGWLASVQSGSGPVLISVVGESCTGKTRSLYEAVKHQLPTWPLIRPARGTGQLLDALTSGIPRRHVLWLDEFQDFVDLSSDGVRTARLLLDLIHHPNQPAIAIVTTMWQSTFTNLAQRPDADGEAAGRSPVSRLLNETAGHQCLVPDQFTDEEAPSSAGEDPRIALAKRTGGGRVAQVLGGGALLLDRNLSPAGSCFGPAAKGPRINYMDVIWIGSCSSSLRGRRVGPVVARPSGHR